MTPGEHEVDVYYYIADLMIRRKIPQGRAFKIAAQKLELLKEELRAQWNGEPKRKWWKFW